MKPFQTKAVQLVLVAVALVLGYATLVSAASTLPCRASEPAADGKVHLQWTVIAMTSATRPNENSVLAPATPIRTAAGLNDGVEVLQVGTNADTDDGLTNGDAGDPLGIDPMEDDANGDGLSDGDLEF